MRYIEVITYLAFVIFTPREMIQFDVRRFFKGVETQPPTSYLLISYKNFLGYPSVAEFEGDRWFV